MSQQNYQNHVRKAPALFYVSALLSLSGLIASIVYIFIQSGEASFCNCTVYLLLSMVFFVGLMGLGFARMFALKAQDRAIRAEENLRHFVLTGKLLHPQLKMNQIIALRFASDDEFVSLAEKALSENLNGKQIKQAIKKWKADEYRV
jgi:hypothetical protein